MACVSPRQALGASDRDVVFSMLSGPSEQPLVLAPGKQPAGRIKDVC